MTFDLIAHIHRQREWSFRTFGPDALSTCVIEHIRKELIEIEQSPTDLLELVDVILLAIDGAWRAGHSPEAIAHSLVTKQRINENREWPDWRQIDRNSPIEHKR